MEVRAPLVTPHGIRFIRALLTEETEQARERRHAGDDYSEVVLDHGPHYEVGTIDVVGERFDGEDAYDLDDGYENAEGKEAEDDQLLAGRDFGPDKEGEGGEHAGEGSAGGRLRERKRRT